MEVGPQWHRIVRTIDSYAVCIASEFWKATSMLNQTIDVKPLGFRLRDDVGEFYAGALLRHIASIPSFDGLSIRAPALGNKLGGRKTPVAENRKDAIWLVGFYKSS